MKTVDILRLGTPQDNWYSISERGDVYSMLPEYGWSCNFNYYPTPPDRVNLKGEVIDIADFAGSWQPAIMKQSRVPVIATIFESSIRSLINSCAVHNVTLSLVREKISRFIARTKWNRDMLIQFGIDGNRISVIPAATTESVFDLNNAVSPVNSPEKLRFLYVGSLNYNKGVHHLIDAFSKNSGSNNVLTIVSGEFNNDKDHEILALARSKSRNPGGTINVIKPNGNAKYPGNFMYFVKQFYDTHDVFLHHQSFEVGEPIQFGHPMLWAISSGLSVVSLDMGGAREFIIGGANGLLCMTYADFGKAIKAYCSSDLRTKGQRDASLQLARTKFSSDAVGKKYSEVLSTL